ncbi:UNVERIFIED_CONTAM: protein CfxQ [Sesamum radiatum]|uniref:Protein CfxQ n=1 Tax=Sesamum radiatum TaxID=300843 RepID=A0AAW2R2Q2_SESRA
MRIQDKNSKLMPGGGGNTQLTLHACAEAGDLIAFQTLLRQNPALLNQRSILMAQTPLHVAASLNRVEMVKYLLDWGGPGKVELEAKNVYGETPLHVAAKSGCNEAARMVLDYGAYIEARTNEGKTPFGYVPAGLENVELLTLLCQHVTTQVQNVTQQIYNTTGYSWTGFPSVVNQSHYYGTTNNLFTSNLSVEEPRNYDSGIKGKMDEFEHELSKIVGLCDLKLQLRKWAKGMLLDEKRRAMGLNLGPRKPPHMAFLGNPGTGKTTVARILGKLLHSVEVLSTDNVTEVQRTDLVGEYLGQTGPKTRKKIEDAMGGILFVDEAYRLAPSQTAGDHVDYGVEALEEIMSVLEDGNIVVIFAGYTEPMKRVFSSNEGFCRRVTHFFQFDDFTCKDLAEMLMIKMSKQDEKSRLYGFKLKNIRIEK